MEKSKRVYRLPPCAAYNAEQMEGWLYEMAGEGLVLTGFTAGLGVFTAGDGRGVRYSLVPAVDAGIFDSANGVPPDRDTVEMMRDFGWEYIAKRGAFHIYRSTDGGAADMHSDNDVYVLALREVRNRKLRRALMHCAMWIIIFAVRQPLIVTIMHSRLRWLLAAVAILLICQMFEILHLTRLIRRLGSGGAITPRPTGVMRGVIYNVLRITAVVLVSVCFAMILLNIANVGGRNEDAPLEEYSGDPPIATLTDIFGTDKDYDPTDGAYRIWSDMLADVNLSWDESATVTRADGYPLRGWLTVYYHEAKNERTAISVAKGHTRNLKRDNVGYSEKRPLDVSHLDCDYADGRVDSLGRECLVVCEGNKVLCVRLSQYGLYTIPLEEWTTLAAEYLK